MRRDAQPDLLGSLPLLWDEDRRRRFALAAHLVDAFEDVTATMGRPQLLCTAADKNTEGVINPNTHERAYPFKQTPSPLRFTATTADVSSVPCR